MNKAAEKTNAHEKGYLIYAFTNRCGVFYLIFGVFIPILSIFFLVSNLGYYCLLVFVGMNIPVWIVIRNFLLQPIEVLISGGQITFNYLSRDRSEVRKRFVTSLDQVSRFSDIDVRPFSGQGVDQKFQLFFHQGQKFTLYKSGFWNRKDDFESLIHDFKTDISKYNFNRNQTVSSKSRGKSEIGYGDNSYLISALCFWGLACLTGFFFIHSLMAKDFNLIALILAFIFSASGFFRYRMHLNMRKKRL